MTFGRRAQRVHVVEGQLGERVAEPPDARGQLSARRAHGSDGLVDVVEDGGQPVEQRPTGEGERHVLGGAPQQHAAERAFQRGDLAAQGGR